MNKEKSSGFATLLGVLVLGAVSLAAVVTTIFSSVGNTKNSIALAQKKGAEAYASACMEEALQTIRDDNNFIGTQNMNFSLGNCSYVVTNLGGEARSIASSGNIDKIVSRIEVEINQIIPNINIVSWQEVADF